jgi:hypothetical protein
MEKQSAKIYGELQATLSKLRGLNAEMESLQPLPDHSTFHAKNERQDRLDRLSIEIRNANTSASDLRKRYSEAMAAEQRPPVGGPSEALAAL